MGASTLIQVHLHVCASSLCTFTSFNEPTTYMRLGFWTPRFLDLNPSVGKQLAYNITLNQWVTQFEVSLISDPSVHLV